MHPPPTPLPLLPAGLLHRHNCGQPNDTRFRSAARLRQSLWREEHGYACGRYLHPDGRTCRLGSMVPARIGQRGVNLIDASLIPLVQWEIAYRELGAGFGAICDLLVRSSNPLEADGMKSPSGDIAGRVTLQALGAA
jgi:hypothetical protein